MFLNKSYLATKAAAETINSRLKSIISHIYHVKSDEGPASIISTGKQDFERGDLD